MPKLIAGLMLLLIFPLAGGAQDLPTASQKTNSEWYKAIEIRWKLGQAREAGQIARQHFRPIDQAMGRGVIVFVHESGRWDETLYFPMEGPGDLAWYVTPNDEEWFARLAEQEGGAEEAMAVFMSFVSKIADSNVTIVRRPG